MMSDATSKTITVLNPAVAGNKVDRIPLAPRLDALEGKTLYMVDINWGGPDAANSVFEQIQAWLAAHVPSVKTIIRKKHGWYEADDPDLWQEIKENGHAAIVGISG
jgi:hypothetical protein